MPLCRTSGTHNSSFTCHLESCVPLCDMCYDYQVHSRAAAAVHTLEMSRRRHPPSSISTEPTAGGGRSWICCKKAVAINVAVEIIGLSQCSRSRNYRRANSLPQGRLLMAQLARASGVICMRQPTCWQERRSKSAARWVQASCTTTTQYVRMVVSIFKSTWINQSTQI